MRAFDYDRASFNDPRGDGAVHMGNVWNRLKEGDAWCAPPHRRHLAARRQGRPRATRAGGGGG